MFWMIIGVALAGPTLDVGAQGMVSGRTQDQRDLGVGVSAVFRPISRVGIELNADWVANTHRSEASVTSWYTVSRRSQEALMVRFTPLRGELGWDGAGLGTVAVDLDLGAGAGLVQTRQFLSARESLGPWTWKLRHRGAAAWVVEPRIHLGRLAFGLGMSGRHWSERVSDDVVSRSKVISRIDAQLRISWRFGSAS